MFYLAIFFFWLTHWQHWFLPQKAEQRRNGNRNETKQTKLSLNLRKIIVAIKTKRKLYTKTIQKPGHCLIWPRAIAKKGELRTKTKKQNEWKKQKKKYFSNVCNFLKVTITKIRKRKPKKNTNLKINN